MVGHLGLTREADATIFYLASISGADQELYDAMMAISAHTMSKTQLASLLRKLALDTQRRLAESSGNAED